MIPEWWKKGRCNGAFFGNMYVFDIKLCNTCGLLSHCRAESNDRAGVEQ